jgi:hypothetical protein
MREIRTSGSTRGSGRRALLRKRRLSLSTLPAPLRSALQDYGATSWIITVTKFNEIDQCLSV